MPPRLRACDGCSKRKIQCVRPDPEGLCERCAKLHLECVTTSTPIVKIAVGKQVAALESRVAELEASLVQMRSEISATRAASSLSTSRGNSEDTTGCISPYLQEKTANTTASIWTCLGEHWYFKGIPINSPQGRQWISSKIGESVSLNGFRLFGSQKHHFSSSSPLFTFPERQMIEAFLNSYFTSPWRLLYPIIDIALVEETLAAAYTESQSAQVCLLAFMALCSRMKGSLLQLDDSDVYIRASHSYLPQLLGQSTLESLQTVIMLQIYHLLSGQWGAAAELHPYACRAIYDLKGHSAHPRRSDAGVDRRQRHIRNLFWVCYILDKDIALRYGRPPCLTRDYCDLTLPDDWARVYQGRAGTTQGGMLLQDDSICFSQDLCLSQIKEKICLFLCSLDNSKLSDGAILGQVRQLDVDLETWRSSIPNDYRPKWSLSSEHPILQPDMSFVQRIRCIHLQLEYKYLMTMIHTAVRRCGAKYAVDDKLPEDLHNVYHSSSDISLEASRTTLQIFKSQIDILQEDMFGHVAIYPPIAAMALFMNLLLHPSDPRARNDLDLLAGCATLFQDMPMRDLTNDDIDCIQELNRFISELIMSSTTTIQAQSGTLTISPNSKPSHGHELKDKTPLQAMSHGDVVLRGIPTHPDFASQRQWQLEHMAAAFRHWHREGYVEGISGHISVRDPEFTDAFWTNPLGRHFGLLKVSDMILVNLKGEVIGGNRSRPPNSAGFLIHASIHKARSDVHAICHCHSIHGKAWSVFGKRLEMLTQDVCKFRGDAHSVYDSYGGVVLGSEEGDRIAAAMGPKGKGCILRNHGILTVGQTVDEAAWLYTSMERSCRVQLLAEAAAANGLPKVLIDDEEANFNFDVESDPEICYCEFQAYYDLEDELSNGAFKK
ncbi:transcriptional regulatory [Fusarium tjaetaba]|uniref:Transcriptional regulatory n=1 Tax=Fusarium tjaetaba TaxID=1567544 RepID=A0A8H5V9G1_9HYPO|nr:transcriptional regulatory [Fusarium tjaetaba]KAF5615391.1 transcriptional regulatory [Fusarium tjaetaba]